jgi:putative isomerase
VLRFPSISPSLPHKQYSSELWDWDTLWTSRGLLRVATLAGDSSLRAGVIEHARGSVLNFLDHQASDGRIPMLITVTNPDPLGCLKGAAPHKENQAKPVLAQLALLVSDEIGASWLAPHFDQLVKFFDSWTTNNLSHTGLLVWGDDVAIGNDNDPTTFGRPFFSSANLLLNTLYYEDLRAAAELARRLNRSESAGLSSRAANIRDSLQACCWDSRDQFFYTADVQCADHRASLIPNIRRGMDMSWKSLPLRIQTFTGFLPMWCGIATNDQARSLVSLHYSDPKTFHAYGGVRTLSGQESMYSLAQSSNPSNWLGPIWIIANYFVWSGLKRYGYDSQAADLADKTIRLLSRDLASSGSLNEYYHPDTAAPLSHAGFMDWNLLVLEMA